VTALLVLVLANVDLVADGKPVARLAWEGGPRAEAAAKILNKTLVLMTGTALPEGGTAPPLRFVETRDPGYIVRTGKDGVTVEGSHLVHAVYDMLEGWGCRFGGDEPFLPEHERVSVRPFEWRPRRALYVADSVPDLSLRADGIAIRGLQEYARRRDAVVERRDRYGALVRVASTTFDDFLPPRLYEAHPRWFALRRGERVPRGNFALTDAEARAFYLDALGRWLETHPEVDVAGLWPEVTEVWCEDTLKIGAPEGYALLWREAARRFPDRRFEILATGLTLRPPKGKVPANVEVLFRPGKETSLLQGVMDPRQEESLTPVVKAWRARGAKVVLEIDGAPESWCGLPWPCHDAVRFDAAHFEAAVLRGVTAALAGAWRRPEVGLNLDAALATLVTRARGVRSWGDLRDTPELFVEDAFPLAYRVATVERLNRMASEKHRPADQRRMAAQDAFLGFLALQEEMGEAEGRAYARYRGADFRRMQETLLPDGTERKLGPARLKETMDTVWIETDLLRLGIDRRKATVVSLLRKRGIDWGEDLGGADGRFFSVVAVNVKGARRDGRISFKNPEPGVLDITLRGRVGKDGSRWSSTLVLKSGSGLIRQIGKIEGRGIASGCQWSGGPLDRWVCPAFVREGSLGAPEARFAFPMPAGTLLYCRAGETGPGLAARLPRGGPLTVSKGKTSSLVTTAAGDAIAVDWIVFAQLFELGR
jgi:hypothetical protein